MSDFQYKIFLQFYDVTLNHGANSFKMNLDSGTGLEEHQCFIKPGTLKANRPSHNNWYVNFTATAEVTPSQNEVCDNLYSMYDCYGDKSCALVNAFESFIDDLPEVDATEAITWILGRDGNLDKKVQGGVNVVRGSSATYIDPADGILKTLPDNQLRLESQGWLIEGASTNLALNSEDLSQWADVGDLIITTNTTESPTGDVTSDTISSVLGGISNRLEKGFAFTDTSTEMTLSWFVSQGTAEEVTIELAYTGGSGVSVADTFNFSSGEFTGSSGNVVREGLSNGFWRISITLASNGTNNVVRPRLYIPSGGSGSVNVFGAQLEDDLLFASSYIKTTTSFVTRLADTITVSSDNIPSQSLSDDWSITLNFNLLAVANGEAQYFFDARDNSIQITGYSLQQRGASDDLRVTKPSGSHTFGTITANKIQKTSLSVGGDELSVFINSLPISTNSLTLAPTTTGSPLYIGSNSNLSGHIYGHISDFRMYDLALTAEQIATGKF